MSIFKNNKLKIATLECKIQISYVLMNRKIVRFKIGKTVDPLEKRYNESDEYKNNYDEIILIYETEDKALVDSLEKCLIHDYRVAYPSKCQNGPKGRGPNCADSDNKTASIYIVVKSESV